MKRPHIPRSWTGEQARDVTELLEQLIDDIWRVYADEITFAQRLRERPPPSEEST